MPSSRRSTPPKRPPAKKARGGSAVKAVARPKPKVPVHSKPKPKGKPAPKPVAKPGAAKKLATKPPAKPSGKPPAKPSPTRAGSAKPKPPTKPAAAPPEPEPQLAVPLPGGRKHVLSLSFVRDGDEFLARLETDGGHITELKNRSLDQLLTLVAGELEDLLV